MERKGPPISLDEFRRRFGNRPPTESKLTPLEQISAVQQAVQGVVQRAEKQYADIGEDAYDTRNEAWKHLNFLGDLQRKIQRAKPGGTVDLTRKIVDYGYDPEEAAAAQDAGVDYRTEADQAEAEYSSHLYGVRALLPRLQKAGVQVKVGFKRIRPEE